MKLQLISDNNQVIQERETDLEGRAWFKDWKNNPYNFNPYVVVAQLGDDWSFLRLEQAPVDQSRFDVGGDPFQSSGWDGFLTSDRGLYRPGDTANFTAVVRQADLEIPDDLPVNLVIRDGSGNQAAKLTAKLHDYGMATFTFPIPEDITTGMMNVELSLENGVHLAGTSIKVEEFIPNTIKVEVKPSKKTADPGEQLSFRVTARELFGAPGVNLQVHAAVQLAPLEYTNKDWKGYHFSDPTRQFSGESLKVPNGTTDAAGNYDVQLPVPISMLPPSMMQAEVYAEVLDTGGRPVGANAVIRVHRYPYYLGLKCEEGKEVAPNKKVHIKYVAITPERQTHQGGKGHFDRQAQGLVFHLQAFRLVGRRVRVGLLRAGGGRQGNRRRRQGFLHLHPGQAGRVHGLPGQRGIHAQFHHGGRLRARGKRGQPGRVGGPG